MQKIYCSLDIETSGFDPVKNEILEVGLAFFTVEDGGCHINEEYTRVFKPKQEVPVSILGLTGISLPELEHAKPFEFYKHELQEKLRDAVIVGHNVIFDIKFLQSQGLEFSGKVIDTLDLVQFILPTHHSYNLENLMHLFSIPHTEAHRALPDSKAAIKLLEALFGVHTAFPEALKKQIEHLAQLHELSWASLLKYNFPARVLRAPLKNSKQPLLNPIPLKTKTIYNFPVGKNCLEHVFRLAEEQKQKTLVVTPKVQHSMDIWKKGLAEPVFSSELQFNEKKFTALLEKEIKTLDEVKFILKILVWQYTNWQTKTFIDLNLSFFGGQFKDFINGGDSAPSANAKIICTDQENFLQLSRLGLYTNRLVVVVGFKDFEENMSTNLGTKASWGYTTYLLKSIYNPELVTGNESLKQMITEALNATDLFFGLVGALLGQAEKNFQYYKIDSQTFYAENFNKIKHAAGHYIAKLRALNEHLQLEEISKIASSLEQFFIEDSEYVKWIELAEKRCVFFSAPISITQLVAELLSPYDKICFADSLASEKLIGYFITRLGLQTFGLQPIISEQLTTPLQRDLFSAFKKAWTKVKKNKPAKCYCQVESLTFQEIRDLASKNLPAAVLFGTTVQIKKFYNEHYSTLQTSAFLFVQNNSGGSNKIFHNFGIHANSLLIASDKFILKHLQNNKNTSPIEHVAVKTLILCHLPFEQFSHPYQEAISAQFENSFEDFSLPRAVQNLQGIIEFFISEDLENIYICDAKMAKGYARAFKEYLQQLPNIELIELSTIT